MGVPGISLREKKKREKRGGRQVVGEWFSLKAYRKGTLNGGRVKKEASWYGFTRREVMNNEQRDGGPAEA